MRPSRAIVVAIGMVALLSMGRAATRGKEPMTTLQLTASATGPRLTVSWKNTGQTPLAVATHVDAGEKHFDGLTVTLIDAGETARRLTFTDNRDESAPVVVDLPGGATTSETIDLAAWAVRTINGARPLVPGHYRALVVYDSTRETRAWAGRLETTASVDVP